ncbi:hypothetical protein SY212_12060 [Ligilactobacillus agilis]|uniref:Uncharacterized protein n=1 Tax=Ligilactobacillus agilis TaxID=1601 RepID=A0A6F9XLQ0_9LACO|nr:hypothetical protein SY212_12060 [Ligilactobacillus agilis]
MSALNTKYKPAMKNINNKVTKNTLLSILLKIGYRSIKMKAITM